MLQLIFLGSLFFALLTVYVLLLKKDAIRSYADYLLSFFILVFSWNVFIYLLLHYTLIIDVPFLYKTAAPLAFVIPPLSYFYTRAILFNEKKFTTKDLIHFIPFILVTINYLPFFLIPFNEKKVIVTTLLNNLDLTYQYQAGMVSEYEVFIARVVQILLYTIFQWKLILKYKRKNKVVQIENQIKDILHWLRIFTWFCTTNVIALFVLIILVVSDISVFNNMSFLNLIPLFFFVVGFFVITTYLLSHPNILAGLPFVKYKETKSILSNNEVNKVAFIEEDYSKEIENINNYFNINKPYLNSNLTLGQVSVALNIPIRELSYILNNYFNQRFTDFVNAYRLKYITDKFNESYLDNFTIESVALEAGFTTKSGFYKSFKKLYQTTPSEYFQQKRSN